MSESPTVPARTPRRRFKPYPEYRDSGVEWLGAVPAGWEVRRLKTIATVRLSNVDKKSVEGEEPVLLCNYVDVYYNDRITGRIEFMAATATREQVRRFSLRAGDVLITKDSESWTDIAVPAVVEEDLPGVLCGYHLAHIRPGRTCHGAFLSREFGAVGPRDQFQLAANGITRFGLGGDAIQTGSFAVPPVGEQRLIATFLDRETGRIDELVAKKERLIELLQEKRAALITRAVTKGLDPSAPLKDSGVEWLGEMPAHWEVVVLKRRTRRIQAGVTPPTGEERYYEDGAIPWYGPASFSDDLPLQAPTKLIAESAPREGAARVFDAGSCMIVTIGATVGKVAYMQCAGSCNQQITCVSFDGRRVVPKYGAYQLKRLEPVLRGIAPSTTLPILDQTEVGYLPFAVPSLPEQRAIADYLDRETARIDALVAKVREAIGLLKEYRTALISAAVTGKIDVRGLAA